LKLLDYLVFRPAATALWRGLAADLRLDRWQRLQISFQVRDQDQRVATPLHSAEPTRPDFLIGFVALRAAQFPDLGDRKGKRLHDCLPPSCYSDKYSSETVTR
jgi:hypothetical protein